MDPYGVNQGFWHCHMGWLLWKKPKAAAAKVDVSDLHKVSLGQTVGSDCLADTRRIRSCSGSIET
jgi:fatty-acid desaturase